MDFVVCCTVLFSDFPVVSRLIMHWTLSSSPLKRYRGNVFLLGEVTQGQAKNRHNLLFLDCHICWFLVVTSIENINFQVGVYLNLRLLENFRLSSLRFVSRNRSGFYLALGFGLFLCYHKLSISQAVSAGIREMKEEVKLYQRQNKIQRKHDLIYGLDKFLYIVLEILRSSHSLLLHSGIANTAKEVPKTNISLSIILQIGMSQPTIQHSCHVIDILDIQRCKKKNFRISNKVEAGLSLQLCELQRQAIPSDCKFGFLAHWLDMRN